ncbi:MAG: 5-formyltetrahydrofolate cyclo-ligase [Thermoguttaceae bacterium]
MLGRGPAGRGQLFWALMHERDGVQGHKREIRRLALARRAAQPDPESASLEIIGRLVQSPEYLAARTVLAYVSFRDEVSTRQFFPRAWVDGKRLAVPYCTGDRLELFLLRSFGELAPGTLGILEPEQDLRGLADRRVGLADLDLVVVPGLAFDPQCGRIGYGKGYYDRLLREVPDRTALVAVAFRCQVFPEVPVLGYDVRMDQVLTEAEVYRRRQPRRSGAGG